MTNAASVRAAQVRDAVAISGIYAPYVSGNVITFEVLPPGAQELSARMLATPRLPWLVAVREKEVVGYAYGSPHRARAAYRWSADVSVYLHPDERGRGTGRALYELLIPALRGLGYVTAYAGITLPNEASVGLHEALGFTAVGVYRQVGFKHGAWHDVGWWQLQLTDPPPDPPEPAPWAGNDGAVDT